MSNRLHHYITTFFRSSLELHTEQRTECLIKSPGANRRFQKHIRDIQELKVQAGALVPLVPLIQSATKSQVYWMTGLIKLEHKAEQDQDQSQDRDAQS